MGYFFLEFLASEVLWILKYNYLPKFLLTFQNETLLLKIPHTWVIECGDIKLAMTWRLYPSWIVFIVLEGALPTTRWRTLIISLPSCEPMSHNDDLSGKTCPLVQRGTGVIGVTNYFLIETYPWHNVKAKNLGTDRSYNLGENLLLLLWQNGILFSSWMCHYIHRLVHFSTLIRETSFCSGLDFTQRPTTTMVWGTIKCGMLGHLYYTPFLRLRDHCGKWETESWESEVVHVYKETLF